MRDYKPLAIVALSAAWVVAYMTVDEQSIAWTQDTAVSILKKSIAAEMKRERITSMDLKSERLNENNPNILSFYLKATLVEVNPPRNEDSFICIAETKGVRIPFFNVALAKSNAACSVGELAAQSKLEMNETGYWFKY